MISRGSNPVLSLVTKVTVNVDFPVEEYYMPSLPKKETVKNEGECELRFRIMWWCIGQNFVACVFNCLGLFCFK